MKYGGINLLYEGARNEQGLIHGRCNCKRIKSNYE